jgi:GntR family L-lactate dehydrogenase operon transcriptional regulator
VLNDKEKLEHDILSIIGESDGRPMGCGSVSIKMQSFGYSFSEATIGRILRDLDMAGLTEKAGFRGRKLSSVGSERLCHLAGKERRLKQGEELLAAVQGHTREQLLEVLIARRAIESELAYLAAQNAKPEEVHILHAALARQRHMLDFHEGAAAEDVAFHNIIVSMAGNRVLAAAVNLIRQDTQLSPVLEHIRLHVRSLVYVDHEKIVEAIKNRDSDKARAAMVKHINNLISDVEKYWRKQ